VYIPSRPLGQNGISLAYTCATRVINASKGRLNYDKRKKTDRGTRTQKQRQVKLQRSEILSLFYRGRVNLGAKKGQRTSEDLTLSFPQLEGDFFGSNSNGIQRLRRPAILSSGVWLLTLIGVGEGKSSRSASTLMFSTQTDLAACSMNPPMYTPHTLQISRSLVLCPIW